MNRKMPYDQTLILTVLSLTASGLLMVFSASAAVSQDIYGDHGAIFARQMIATLIGVAALLIAMRIDYQHYHRTGLVVLILGVSAALLVLPHLLGGEGPARWVRFAGLQFQPSEVAKVAALVFAAYYLSRKKAKLESFWRDVLPLLAVVGALIGFVLAGRDLGTATCMALVCGLLLFFGGLSYRHALYLSLGGVAGLAALIYLEPYRIKRILAFLDPSLEPHGVGYQVRQSLIAVGSGGIHGVGFGGGQQKLHFLPEPHTDFIFAVIGEELGLIGCLAVVGLFGIFLWRGIRIALRADSPFGFYLATGIVGMIVLQALINMSVVVQLLPTKGIPLPFISVGGSSMIVMLGATGILLNISKHARNNSLSPM